MFSSQHYRPSHRRPSAKKGEGGYSEENGAFSKVIVLLVFSRGHVCEHLTRV